MIGDDDDMKRLEDVQAEINALMHSKYELEDKEFREKTLPRVKSQIGSTWVYRNNGYSSDETWDQFKKLVEVREGNMCRTVFIECYIDSEERAFLQHNLGYLNRYNQRVVEGGWESCTAEEFELNYRKVIAALGIFA
jgi:hypothetical protein